LFVLTAGETARKSSGHRSSTGSAINLKVYPLAVTPEMVAQRTTSLYQSLPNRDDSFHPISSELYNWLVKPAEQQLAGKSNLIIIPHGILWHLPFEALQASADRYLLDQVSISYAPSFSSLREMIKQRRPTTRRRSGNSVGLLAFGDPTLSQELLQRIELTYENLQFNRSPEQDSEVQKVKALYGDANSRVFTGVNASEERAKTELARAGLLHFAAPAILDDISPMYSFVALASGGAGQSDGLFQPGEIIHLQTSARLAVLSAASRRLDQTGTGAAPIGLAWSWFVAGTPSVVCSRWEVRSPATSRLMFEFHSRLKASGRPASLATALQQSALTLRHSADYKHPYYWANFSLLGKGK